MYINNTIELIDSIKKKRINLPKKYIRANVDDGKKFNVLTSINKCLKMDINNTIEWTISKKKRICKKKNICANIDDGKKLMY